MLTLPTANLDRLLSSLDHGLRTVFATPVAARASPSAGMSDVDLSEGEARESGALMRVNHVGEVCAQALYQAQALTCRDPALRAYFVQAAQEEMDHLAWTEQRVHELGTHVSRLTPIWYGGAFAFGALAGLAGDSWSLGFVVETERQVEQHLAGHLDRLPEADLPSRAIVAHMKEDEARHAAEATAAGARSVPQPVKILMRWTAGVMTRTAHHV